MDILLSALEVFISGFVLLATLTYFKFIKKNSHVVQHFDKFPGPPISFPFGNALSLAVENHELLGVFEKWYKESNLRTYRIWGANKGRLVVCEAHIVEKILSSSVNIEKSDDYHPLHPWLNTGLLTSSGTKWFSRRKLITPTFHFKILDEFLDVFNEQGEILVQILLDECSHGQPFDIFPYLARCALDIISETAMGGKIMAQKERDSEYVRAIYAMGDLLMRRALRPWLHSDIIWKFTASGREEKRLLKILHGFSDKAIKDRKEYRKSHATTKSDLDDDEEISMSGKKRLAFLDLLLDYSDNGRVLSDADIREETDTFMFEGHDTTASNLCWTIFCLASNPKYMMEAQEELDGIFGADRSRSITKDDLAQMKYLDCCVKESLRIFPSVPMFARSIQKDVVLDDGRVIPAGCTTTIFTYFLHRDPKYFPNPEEFRPDRFSPENSIGRNPYCYVPFSAGPRNCIGQKFAVMEEKIVLAKLLLNFTFEACDELKDMRLVPDIILRPKDGVNVTMKGRS